MTSYSASDNFPSAICGLYKIELAKFELSFKQIWGKGYGNFN